MDYRRLMFGIGIILVICIFHCTDSRQKISKNKNPKSVVALSKKSGLRSAPKSQAVKLKKKPLIKHVVNSKRKSGSKNNNDIRRIHNERAASLARKQRRRNRNHIVRGYAVKPRKNPLSKPRNRKNDHNDPKSKSKLVNKKGHSSAITKRCSKWKPGQLGYTNCKRRYNKTERKQNQHQSIVSYQSDDPKENEVIQEDKVRLWYYNEQKQKCVQRYIPKSRAERNRYFYKKEEDCKPQDSGINKPLTSSKKRIKVYQYSPQTDTCKTLESYGVGKHQYKDYQTCYDKNIQVYFDISARKCSKWRQGMSENSKKFKSFGECVSQRNKGYKYYHLYDHNQKRCSMSITWRARARYNSFQDCQKYRGGVFFIYDREENKCLRTVDGRAFPAKTGCKEANKSKIVKKIFNDTSYVYDPEEDDCVQAKAGVISLPRVYESWEDCNRDHSGVNQPATTKLPVPPVPLYENHSRKPSTSDEKWKCATGWYGIGATEFQCKNGVCINKLQKCDYVDNCGDNSDEEDCWSHPKGIVCTDGYMCGDGTCIPPEKHCDGKIDCEKDKFDELDCHLYHKKFVQNTTKYS